MRKINFLIPVLFSIFLSGCLNYRFMEVRMFFSETDANEGRIEIIYRDLGSDAIDSDSRQSDYNSLLELISSDDMLLDYLEEGMYVQKRGLFAENGLLNARLEGLFRNFRFDGRPLRLTEKLRELRWDDSDLLVDHTNGTVTRLDTVTIVRWPADQRELHVTFKQKETPADVFSLIPYFKSRKNMNPHE